MTSIYQVPYTTTTLLVLAGATTTLLAIVALYQVIYRLYLHPLAKFPGPKLGAISRAYEFYYDFVKRGQMAFQVGRLHERYGGPPSPSFLFLSLFQRRRLRGELND